MAASARPLTGDEREGIRGWRQEVEQSYAAAGITVTPEELDTAVKQLHRIWQLKRPGGRPFFVHFIRRTPRRVRGVAARRRRGTSTRAGPDRPRPSDPDDVAQLPAPWVPR